MAGRMDYDGMAEEYASYRIAIPAVLQSLLRSADLGPSSRVLEVGCGNGNYILGIRGRTGAECWGLDPSEEMLSFLGRASKGVRTVKGIAEHMDIPDEQFDLVFSVDVIHHLDDRLAYFMEAVRVLRPRGLLCTVTDSEEIIRQRVPLSKYFPESVEPELARYPGIGRLEREMTEAGLRELRSEEVRWPYDMTDPSPYRARAFSALLLISDEALERGLARMEADLERGPIPCHARYLLLWGRR